MSLIADLTRHLIAVTLTLSALAATGALSGCAAGLSPAPAPDLGYDRHCARHAYDTAPYERLICYPVPRR